MEVGVEAVDLEGLFGVVTSGAVAVVIHILRRVPCQRFTIAQRVGGRSLGSGIDHWHCSTAENVGRGIAYGTRIRCCYSDSILLLERGIKSRCGRHAIL